MYSHHHQASLISISLFLLLLSSTLSAELCHPQDKKTLFNIKKAFNNAYMFASWTHNTDCCEWYLVECDETTHRITSLIVSKDDKVAGSIPDAVGDLPYLESLTFHKLPKLTGHIPQAISKLKNLKFLTLTHNNLTGRIPDFLSQLTKLSTINLAVNKLTGPIPPSLSSLKELGGIFLERNQLTGQIPESFGKFKQDDFYLHLAKNKLSGPLPKSFGAPNFASLDLSRNKFSFDLSKVVFTRSLFHLELSHNMIYGSLPPVLAKLPNLQQFNVSYNRLCGRIPRGGELNRYNKYDYAHNKCLCDSPLPPCK